MVTRRLDKRTNDKVIRMKSTNEGASCFTDFFDERHPMNENPSKPFFEFMNDHEVDIHKGEVRRRK